MPHKRLFPALSAVALALGGAAAAAPLPATLSAFRKADGIPQPHLIEARRLAAEENFWKVPILNVCYREDSGLSQEIIVDPEPTRLTDDLYYLGMGQWGAWALDTPEGIVVIDALNNEFEAARYIVGGLEKLGLDPARIKAVIVSHGHGDHYGGAAYLQQRFKAKVYMGEADWAFAQQRARTVPANRPTGPVPRPDVMAKDGDTLTLGGAAIRFFTVPGHTPATLALLLPTRWRGQAQTVVFHGGVTSSNGFTPAAHEAFDRAMDRLIAASTQAGATAYMANHPAFDDIARKAIHRRTYPNDAENPFLVGRESTLRFLKIVKACNLNNRDVDAVFAARGQAVGANGR